MARETEHRASARQAAKEAAKERARERAEADQSGTDSVAEQQQDQADREASREEVDLNGPSPAGATGASVIDEQADRMEGRTGQKGTGGGTSDPSGGGGGLSPNVRGMVESQLSAELGVTSDTSPLLDPAELDVETLGSSDRPPGPDLGARNPDTSSAGVFLGDQLTSSQPTYGQADMKPTTVFRVNIDRDTPRIVDKNPPLPEAQESRDRVPEDYAPNPVPVEVESEEKEGGWDGEIPEEWEDEDSFDPGPDNYSGDSITGDWHKEELDWIRSNTEGGGPRVSGDIDPEDFSTQERGTGSGKLFPDLTQPPDENGFRGRPEVEAPDLAAFQKGRSDPYSQPTPDAEPNREAGPQEEVPSIGVSPTDDTLDADLVLGGGTEEDAGSFGGDTADDDGSSGRSSEAEQDGLEID